ncbi:MAG: fused MFS/spermidine synthase [Pseudomonadota bacterium]
MSAEALRTSIARLFRATTQTVRRDIQAQDLALVLMAFSGTLFLSALLLFSVQPIFAKMVLPKLGGTPSVWAVSMCFFQAALLAGYCYAHALNRFAPLKVAPLIHLALMGIALIALPFGLPSSFAEPPAGDAYLWLICLLAVGVGLPFFAVAANAPLLQAWFAKTGHRHAADPYFLYGASNLGSLIALLSYPIVIEPWLGLSQQANVWTAGYVLLGVMIALSAVMMVMVAPTAKAAREAAGDEARAPVAPVSLTQRGWWIALAFVPSGLLVAFTSYVTTDIASAPFLWVIPLAIFLGTFILVFRERPLIPHDWMLRLQPAAVVLVLYGLSTPGDKGWLIGAGAGFIAFFVTTMVCHKELYEKRPDAAHLTEFYLWMSLGGVLGGVFAAIVAPQVFNAIYEFPLLLVLGVACRPGVFTKLDDEEKAFLQKVIGGAVVLILAIVWAMNLGWLKPYAMPRIAIMAVFGVLALLATPKPWRQCAYVCVVAAAMVILPSAMNRGNAERSFFGTHRIATAEGGNVRILLHGTTIHGAQRLKTKDGRPVKKAYPMTYYYETGPLARGVGAARESTGKLDGGLRVGVVGLGAGSMACFSKPNETWRFYEIDPVVAKIARDPSKFNFLSDCLPKADIVLGDARLTVAKEKSGAFDYLQIDAFSSDAVPVHLLTVEAIKLYLDKLSPNGILSMHISNRHLDLIDVTSATVAAIPGAHAWLADDKKLTISLDTVRSHVLFITKSEAAMKPLMKLGYVQPAPKTDAQPWTDDYSDILSAIWRKYMK